MIKLKVTKSKSSEVKELPFKKGVTPSEITSEFKIDEKVFLAKHNNKPISLDEKVEIDGDFKFITNPRSTTLWNESNKAAMRVLYETLKDMNLAIEVLHENISEDGFSLDFISTKNISESQIDLIEGKTKKAFKTFEGNTPFKSKDINFLKIRGVGGIKIDDDSKIANRIFGFVAVTKEVFEEKIIEIEDRFARDHRRLGKDLKLFHIDDEIGKGLPIWLPNGLILKNVIKNYISNLVKINNYQEVETPALANLNLFKTSGHYSHYKHGMFPEMINQEHESMMLRPMSCPFHVIYYKMENRSYKDLPFRVSEFVKQYRYEYSGSLIGLERVRAMELTDAHIFLSKDQIKKEISLAYQMIVDALNKFGIEISYVELALHDPNDLEKYHGNKTMWKESEEILREFLEINKIKYVPLEGEAAFYGPKIDIQIKTALGHTVTISTVQLDFYLPEKFNLSYIDSENQKVQPILIHRGLIGTFERFIAILLEQTKGNLPFWLSPEQVTILPVNNDLHLNFSNEVNEILNKENIRSNIDQRNERMSLKIREAQIKKVKLQVVIGDEEVKNKTISYRYSGEENTTSLPLEDFLVFLKNLNNA